MKILGFRQILFDGSEPGGGAAPTPTATPAAAPAPPSASAAPPPASEPKGLSEAAMALLHDPFADPLPPPSEGDQQNQPPATPPAAAPAAPPAATPPVTPSAGVDPALGVLVQGVQQLLERQPPAQPQGQPQDPTADIEVPGYQYNVPDGLVTALAHEDPTVRKQGISALIQGVSQSIHRTVFHAMREHVARTVPQMLQAGLAEQQRMQEIHRDFYGTYKELDNPALYPLVLNVASQLGREMGVTSWSPQFRDAVATRVKAILQSFSGQPAQPAPMVPGGGAPAYTPPAGQTPVAQRTQRDHLHDIFT